MSILRSALVSMFVLVVSINLAQAETNISLPSGITAAINKGDAGSLSVFFNSSIDLVILGRESMCSKSQAEQIMRDFFNKYPNQGFEVLFEGGKENSKYAIGRYTTTNQIFRVYILIKAQIIHQIRIEKDDAN